MRDPSPVGYWRSASARATYLARYDLAFRECPEATEMRDVRTEFGIVRVYRYGISRAGVVPVVLVPGRSSGAPMWADTLSRLGNREAYAIDALGDAGKSVQDRPLGGAGDQAAWLDEALTGLGLTRVHLIGHSFGGWSAANLASRHPERVATLTLWEPILVLAGLRWQMYVATLPSALPFLPESWRRKGLESIGGVKEGKVITSPVAAMIDAGAAGYRAALPTPVQFDDAALARLSMPTFVGLGAQSAVTDAEAAARTARTLPNATVRVWPGGTHSLPMQYPDELHAMWEALVVRERERGF
ncbi:alpha/beta fold hydrolase [Rhodococcus qingshengii]|uniref:alpha/beta fold hydrolase n=1 Tax=Rhodococcus qingshengii TaxID=334542 RepID=UPI001BAFDCB4|nr:alpha/beta hydrolase [Rhodococcus qingshengii]MBS3695706.1 alpha/beta fold hydrolase [Rhodococcus qingshengii]